MKVQLISYTENAEELINRAASICYASDITKKPRKKLLYMLFNKGHMGPFEHAKCTYLVEGISRACSHQLVRHRIASYCQRSQRYVKHDIFEYIIPPSILDSQIDGMSGKEYFEETMKYITERYKKINEALGDCGEFSNQDARYVLPNACETKIIISMNFRSLMHFFEERLCKRAQWEIRNLAQKMLNLIESKFSFFELCGPKCKVLGYCPEGNKCYNI